MGRFTLSKQVKGKDYGYIRWRFEDFLIVFQIGMLCVKITGATTWAWIDILMPTIILLIWDAILIVAILIGVWLKDKGF